MREMWYNYSGNHTKSSGALERTRYPFSTCERGARTMSNSTLSRDKNKRAHKAVENAVRSGKLLPATAFVCAYCQNTQATEYHHHNGYDDAHKIDVVPICRGCHKTCHWHEPEHREAILKGMQGRSDEYRQKMSDSIKAKCADVEWLERRQKSQRLTQNTPEYRQKMSDVQKEVNSRPGAREKKAESARQAWARRKGSAS